MNTVRRSSGPVSLLYLYGAASCMFHGVDLWVSIFWPMYLGAVYADIYAVAAPPVKP